MLGERLVSEYEVPAPVTVPPMAGEAFTSNCHWGISSDRPVCTVANPQKTRSVANAFSFHSAFMRGNRLGGLQRKNDGRCSVHREEDERR